MTDNESTEPRATNIDVVRNISDRHFSLRETGAIQACNSTKHVLLKVEAEYEDRWSTPIANVPLRITADERIISSGPKTSSYKSFNVQEGSKNILPDVGKYMQLVDFSVPPICAVELIAPALSAEEITRLQASIQQSLRRLEVELRPFIADRANEFNNEYRRLRSESQAEGISIPDWFVAVIGAGLGASEGLESFVESIRNLPSSILGLVEGVVEGMQSDEGFYHLARDAARVLDGFGSGETGDEFEHAIEHLSEVAEDPVLAEAFQALLNQSQYWTQAVLELSCRTDVLRVISNRITNFVWSFIRSLEPEVLLFNLGRMGGRVIFELLFDVLIDLIFSILASVVGGVMGFASALAGKLYRVISIVERRLSRYPSLLRTLARFRSRLEPLSDAAERIVTRINQLARDERGSVRLGRGVDIDHHIPPGGMRGYRSVLAQEAQIIRRQMNNYIPDNDRWTTIGTSRYQFRNRGVERLGAINGDAHPSTNVADLFERFEYRAADVSDIRGSHVHSEAKILNEILIMMEQDSRLYLSHIAIAASRPVCLRCQDFAMKRLQGLVDNGRASPGILRRVFWSELGSREPENWVAP